mmetsp:Transcript_37718/g.70784  ORF Transcript_37718/g.70784 Transcript_37718/m.70784 type:complete len:221 (-) Transcript_37718:318-980(-)
MVVGQAEWRRVAIVFLFVVIDKGSNADGLGKLKTGKGMMPRTNIFARVLLTSTQSSRKDEGVAHGDASSAVEKSTGAKHRANLASLQFTEEDAKKVSGTRGNSLVALGHPGLQVAGAYRHFRKSNEHVAAGLDPDKGVKPKGHGYHDLMLQGHKPNRQGFVKHLHKVEVDPEGVSQWERRVLRHDRAIATGDKHAQAYHRAQPRYRGSRTAFGTHVHLDR